MVSESRAKSKFHLLTLIWGIIYTSLLLLAVSSKIVIGFVEEGRLYFNELRESFSDPVNPILFFVTYLIGYIIIWWKPLWGSVIIIIASIYYVVVAGFDGPPILAAPGFLVGILYLVNWFMVRKNQKSIYESK